MIIQKFLSIPCFTFINKTCNVIVATKQWKERSVYGVIGPASYLLTCAPCLPVGPMGPIAP